MDDDGDAFEGGISFFDLDSHFFLFSFKKTNKTKNTAPEEVLQIKHLRNHLKPR